MNKKEVLEYVQRKYGKKISKAEQLYEALKIGKYWFYYNRKHKMSLSALQSFFQGKGVNCADGIRWIVIPCLEALGYTWKIIHAKVFCNDKKEYGHWYLRITGRRFENKIFDIVSACKTGRAFGVACCIARKVKELSSSRDPRVIV